MSGGEVRVGHRRDGVHRAVHARSARLAGARLVGVAASSPERATARRRRARRRARVRHRPRSSSKRRMSTSCTSARPNHLHLPLAEAALAAGKHVICEKPLALDERGAEELAGVRGERRRRRRGAVRLPLLPDGARGARAHPHRRHRADPPDPRRLPAGLAAQARPTTTGASTSSSAAPRVRSPTSARTGATWRSSSPVTASRACQRAHVHIRPRARDGGRRDRAVRDRPRRGRQRGHQPDLRGPQEPAALEIDGADEALGFNQEEPEELWVGRREHATLLKRDPATLCRRRRRAWRRFPPATRRATTTASTRSWPTRTRRRSPARRPTGYRSSRTGCAPRGSPPRCSPPRAPSRGSTCRTRPRLSRRGWSDV